MNVKVCTVCEATSATMLRCSRCRATAYCSQSCQKEHWSIHKGECKNLAALRSFMKIFFGKVKTTLFEMVSIWTKHQNVNTVALHCAKHSKENKGCRQDFCTLDPMRDLSQHTPFISTQLAIELYYAGTMTRITSRPQITGRFLLFDAENNKIELEFYSSDSILSFTNKRL